MLDKIAHEREDAAVVGDGGKNQLAVAKRVFYGFRHVGTSQIVNDNVRAALSAEPISQQLDSFLRVTIDRGVSDDDTVLLRLVG